MPEDTKIVKNGGEKDTKLMIDHDSSVKVAGASIVEKKSLGMKFNPVSKQLENHYA